MKFSISFAAIAFVAGNLVQVNAICSGSSFGVGNVQNLGGDVKRWTVYDNNCNAVDGLTTNLNACFQGIFGCSPDPVYFNQYTNSFTGERYTCNRDSRSEKCGSDVISVCCFK